MKAEIDRGSILRSNNIRHLSVTVHTLCSENNNVLDIDRVSRVSFEPRANNKYTRAMRPDAAAAAAATADNAAADVAEQSVRCMQSFPVNEWYQQPISKSQAGRQDPLMDGVNHPSVFEVVCGRKDIDA